MRGSCEEFEPNVTQPSGSSAWRRSTWASCGELPFRARWIQPRSSFAPPTRTSPPSRTILPRPRTRLRKSRPDLGREIAESETARPRKANSSRPVQTWVSYHCLTYAQPAPFLMPADMGGGDWAMTKFSSVGEHARCLQVPRYLRTYLPT